MNILDNKYSLDGLDQCDYYGHIMKAHSNNAAVSELKASLSDYLDKVKRGHEIVVTDRGRPVARLIPFKIEGPDADRLLSLARRGIIQLAKRPLGMDFFKRRQIKDPEGLVLKALLEEREEGR